MSLAEFPYFESLLAGSRHHLYDAGDLLELMHVAWDRIDSNERRRLAELIHKGAADELEAIHADLVAGRPVRL